MTACMLGVRLIAVILLMVPASSLFAQFGIGPSLDTEGGGLQVQTARRERGGSIIIQWSESMDELSGFSNKTGRWQKLKFEPQTRIQPVCTELVGAIRLKNGMAAYSGETGTWDVVPLPETSTAVPAVSPDVAQFKAGDHFYAFAASTGRWTSPSDPAFRTLSIQYLSPKHISAGEMHEKLLDWMQSVPASEVGGSIQFLNGVLSVLPRNKSWQSAIHAEIALLDVAPFEGATKTNPREPDTPASLESQVATLRSRLVELESSVQSWATLTKAAQGDKPGPAADLRALVEQSFDARQQLQELEAQRMRRKLEQIEANLVLRAAARDAIIERRLSELESADAADATGRTP